jgi:hypothetical protein
MIRRWHAVMALSVALILVTADLAMAQTGGRRVRTGGSARDKIPAFRLGKVRVIPILGLDLGHTSNLYLASDTQREQSGVTEDSDTVTTLQYGLEFVLPATDWTFSLGGRGLRHWYTENSDQDTTDVQIFGTAEVDFPGGLGLKLKDVYDVGYLLPSNEFGPGEDFKFNHLELGAYYTFNDDWRINLDYQNNWIEYEQTNERDRTEHIFYGGLYRRIASRTALGLGVGYSDYGYDDNVAADNTALDVTGTLIWDMTAKSQGTIRAGYEWKTYNLEKDDGNFWILAAGINYRPLRNTSTYLQVIRQTEESSFIDNPWYLHNAVELTVNQNLTKRLYLRGIGELWADDYPNEALYRGQLGQREDDAYRVEGRLGVRLYQGLSLEGRLGYQKRDSNFDDLDYNETTAMITLNAGLATDYQRYRRRY